MEVITFVLIAAGVVIAFNGVRTASRPLDSSLTPLALVASGSAAVALLSALALWLNGAGDPWNAARLTPAIALHDGVKIYWPMDSGPVLSTVVGPVAFLAYTPIGLVPSESPTTLILAASLLNLIGIGLITRWAFTRVTQERSVICLATLLGAHLTLHFPALRCLFGIHSDSPAILLLSTALLALLGADRELSWGRSLVIGFPLALASWSKQSILPAYAVVALLAGLRLGRTAAVRVAAASFVTAVIVAALFVLWLGGKDLWNNMIVIPAHHPWWKMDAVTGIIDESRWAETPFSKFKLLIVGILHLLRAYWYLLLIPAAALWSLCKRQGLQTFAAQATWPAFLLMAFSMVPTAVLGRLKVGGAVNHESFFLFFLVATILLWIVENRATFYATVGLILLTAVNLPQIRDYRGWTNAWENQNEVAYHYLKRHPGQMYFPWNPLSSWLAEKRIYHFDYGVYDRNLGHAQVTSDHLARHLPTSRPRIASYYAHHDYILKTYLTDYTAKAPDPELKDWRIYGPP